MKWRVVEDKNWKKRFAFRVQCCYLCGCRFWLEFGHMKWTGGHRRSWACDECFCCARSASHRGSSE